MFRAELELMAHRRLGLKVAHVVESVEGERSWCGHRGRFSPETVATIAADFRRARDLLLRPARVHRRRCASSRRRRLRHAPLPRGELRLRGALPGRAAGGAAARRRDAQDLRDHLHEIRAHHPLRREHHDPRGGRLAGMRLPASCTKGLCGTCKTRKREARSEMAHAGGIRQREIDAGMVLLCCSKPCRTWGGGALSGAGGREPSGRRASFGALAHERPLATEPRLNRRHAPFLAHSLSATSLRVRRRVGAPRLFRPRGAPAASPASRTFKQSSTPFGPSVVHGGARLRRLAHRAASRRTSPCSRGWSPSRR